MKKLLLILGMLVMVTSLTYAIDEETILEDEVTVARGTAEVSTEVVLSKGDSFMVAFGMETSAVIGGEIGGITSLAGTLAVAQTSAHVGAVSLTSFQNTPYSYK